METICLKIEVNITLSQLPELLNSLGIEDRERVKEQVYSQVVTNNQMNEAIDLEIFSTRTRSLILKYFEYYVRNNERSDKMKDEMLRDFFIQNPSFIAKDLREAKDLGWARERSRSTGHYYNGYDFEIQEFFDRNENYLNIITEERAQENYLRSLGCTLNYLTYRLKGIMRADKNLQWYRDLETFLIGKNIYI